MIHKITKLLFFLIICIAAMTACHSSQSSSEDTLGIDLSVYLDETEETVLNDLEKEQYEVATIETDGYVWEGYYEISDEVAGVDFTTSLQFGIYGDSEENRLSLYQKRWGSHEFSEEMLDVVSTIYDALIATYGEPGNDAQVPQSVEEIEAEGFSFQVNWYNESYPSEVMLSFWLQYSVTDEEPTYWIYIRHESLDLIASQAESN